MHRQSAAAAPTAVQPTAAQQQAGRQRPLPPSQLLQAIAAVNALADLPLLTSAQPPPAATSPQPPQPPQQLPLYVPDEKGFLARASELAFNDAPWMMVPGGAAAGAHGASRA